jgi:hypothetical protein
MEQILKLIKQIKQMITDKEINKTLIRAKLVRLLADPPNPRHPRSTANSTQIPIAIGTDLKDTHR